MSHTSFPMLYTLGSTHTFLISFQCEQHTVPGLGVALVWHCGWLTRKRNLQSRLWAYKYKVFIRIGPES